MRRGSWDSPMPLQSSKSRRNLGAGYQPDFNRFGDNLYKQPEHCAQACREVVVESRFREPLTANIVIVACQGIPVNSAIKNRHPR